MKEQVKNLWKICFTDSDEFMDLYFSLRYREEINLAIRKNEEVVSALQMIPYPMTFCGQIVDTSYISGACTHPEERSQGFMKELLTQSFRRMYQQNVAFSTLIPAEPWLFDYYNRFGYSTVFYYSECTFPVPTSRVPKAYKIHSTTGFIQEVYDYFQSRMRQRPCCIQHTESDFVVILADMSLAEGRIYRLIKDEKIRAMAITYQEEKQLQIKELFSESEIEKDYLLSAIGKEGGYNSLQLIQPATNKNATQKLGMARIIDAQKVLSLWAVIHPQTDISIYLEDSYLPVNNGYYRISQGICTYTQTANNLLYKEMDINELTDYILTPLHPYMSLMLN
ncbi:MAG: GNAT family N-acetyltransferase [Bacteroides sp.]|nr:GNAT family N-acetyltransferase [Bacteroides sp.]